ncbi:MAG: hypothetical protein ABIG44_18975 [Planctomycetota bacterium]
MNRITHTAIRRLTALMPLLVGVTAAQDFALDWWTIDGGGDYGLSGTIGQPDASITMTSGFWPDFPMSRTSA